MNTETFLETFRSLIADGKTKEAEDFIATNITKIPEADQGNMLLELAASAGEPTTTAELAERVKESALDTLDLLDRVEAELE